MKSFITAFVVGLAVLFTANLALAGNVGGCETVAVEGTNYTVFADPTCPVKDTDGGGRGDAMIRLILATTPTN